MTLVVDVQHQLRRFGPVFVTEFLQHLNDKLHGGVVIVVESHFVKTRLFGVVWILVASLILRA